MSDIIKEKQSDEVEAEIEQTFFDSKNHAQYEKDIGILEAVKKYPKEVFWCSVFCLGVVMSGYDSQIISSFYALPAFQKRFGDLADDGTYQISAAWQTALGMGSPIGQVIGTLGIAWPLEWFGRKKTYFVVNIGCLGLIFMNFLLLLWEF